MNKNLRPLAVRAASAVALLTFAAACGDRSSVTGPRIATNNASRTISDGAHGGNIDVFFLPPMVENPNKAPGYGNKFQKDLPLQFKIRDLTAASQPVILTLPAKSSGGEQQYTANWDTKSPALNTSHTYRVEVWIGSKNPAFADVIVASNGSGLKNVNSQLYIGLQDGKTLPLKVRVEENWDCANKSSCVTEVVPNNIPAGQKVLVKSNDQNNAVVFEGTWHAGDFPVVVTIEDVSNTVGGSEGGCAQGLTSMLANNHCVHVTVDPPVTLTAPVIIATCLPNPGDVRQLLVKYDIGETPRYLDDAVPPIVCPEAIGYTGHSKNPFIRLASTAMAKVSKGFRWATGTKPAYAIDLGVGGRLEVGDDFSFFALGLPAEFQAVSPQTFSLPVSNVADSVRVHLHALHHSSLNPNVNTSTVTCAITSGGGVFTSYGNPTTATATYVATDSTYRCPPWLRPSVGGVGTLKVTSNKLDDLFLYPGEEGYDSISGSMTFTATALADLPCSAEGTTHSLNGDSGLVPVTFNNQTGESVAIYWLDYSGNRVLYNTLESTTSYVQQTYITHPWIMIGVTSNTCYGIRMPITGGRTVVIN